MLQTICFYEDTKYRNFLPLTFLRPVFQLRAGILPFYKRASRYFNYESLVLCPRTSLNDITAEQFPEIPVNIIKKGDGDILFLNSRIRDYGDLPKLIEESTVSTIFTSNHETVAVLFKEDYLKTMPNVFTVQQVSERIKDNIDTVTEFHTTATLYNYLWDIMADIEKEITEDFNRLAPSSGGPVDTVVHEGAHMVNMEQIFLGHNVQVFPGAVIAASNGPVYISDNAIIEPHAAIYGPCYIGPNTVVSAGKFASSSIGHTCRVGGEVEWSIFQSYVNKHHDGFIGHSYIGSWVNFGAMTTNSDLKNNYSNIKVSVNGEMTDSNSNKVGSFIGDHTKFGIGTLMNTGINIGVSCNIFGGALVADKEIGSYQWGGSGSFVRYDFDKAVATAEAVAKRRGVTLSDNEKDILKDVFENKLSDDGTFDFIITDSLG